MLMDGWQTVNYLDNIMGCKHETEMCKYSHCTTCKHYTIPNLTTKKYQTNADRIRRMTDEELAEFIDSSNSCLIEKIIGICPHPSANDISCEECVLEWLKSEIK